MSSEVAAMSGNVASPPCVRATLPMVPLFADESPGTTKFVNVWLKLKNVVPFWPSCIDAWSIVISIKGNGLVTMPNVRTFTIVCLQGITLTIEIQPIRISDILRVERREGCLSLGLTRLSLLAGQVPIKFRNLDMFFVCPSNWRKLLTERSISKWVTGNPKLRSSPRMSPIASGLGFALESPRKIQSADPIAKSRRWCFKQNIIWINVDTQISSVGRRC